jgi:hypothetical protein
MKDEITLAGDKARLQLRLLGLAKDQRGVPADPHLAVAATSGSFSGSNPSVHVSRTDWDAFLRDLERLEASRTGEATVTSMSPGALELRIAAVDRLGHLAVVGQISDHVLGRGHQRVTSRIAFEIELDPAALPALLSSLRSLLASP